MISTKASVSFLNEVLNQKTGQKVTCKFITLEGQEKEYTGIVGKFDLLGNRKLITDEGVKTIVAKNVLEITYGKSHYYRIPLKSKSKSKTIV
jgi:hypothetical protein